MFQVSRPFGTTSITHITLTVATAAALSAAPVASAIASPVPEPATTQTTQAGWQDTMNDLAGQARSTSSLAGRRMLHNELTMVIHSRRAW